MEQAPGDSVSGQDALARFLSTKVANPALICKIDSARWAREVRAERGLSLKLAGVDMRQTIRDLPWHPRRGILLKTVVDSKGRPWCIRTTVQGLGHGRRVLVVAYTAPGNNGGEDI